MNREGNETPIEEADGNTKVDLLVENEGNVLKVKADPQDVSPDDRKRNVKKLAGAISHSLRSSGEVNVRCFGNIL